MYGLVVVVVVVVVVTFKTSLDEISMDELETENRLETYIELSL